MFTTLRFTNKKTSDAVSVWSQPLFIWLYNRKRV